MALSITLLSNKSLQSYSNGISLYGPAKSWWLRCLDQVLELLEQMLLDQLGGGGSDVWIGEITVAVGQMVLV
jgi:hypothetical protein